jgi:hypothetical protein
MNMAFRGPAPSTQRPNKAADTPRKTIGREKGVAFGCELTGSAFNRAIKARIGAVKPMNTYWDGLPASA